MKMLNDLFNHWLKVWHDNGQMPMIQSVYGYLIILVELAFGMLLAHKMKIKWWKSLIILAVGYGLRALLNPLVYWIERGFEGNFSGGALTRIYLLLPVFYFIMFRLMRIDLKRGFDFVALGLMLLQGLAHIGCFLNGCCSGAYTDDGMWNHARNAYTFPTPLYDGVLALVVFSVVFLLFALNRWEGGGFLYPILLITHGIARFIWDFFRVYEKLPCGLSTLQIWAIVLFAVGTAVLTLQIILYVKECRAEREKRRKKRR